MNRSLPSSLPAALIALLLLGASASAGAAAARTFVSATSAANDSHTSSNCGALTPCRTFGAALSVTSAGGEVVVLDSGGYGAFTIAQSVSIIAPDGVYAGVGVASGTGITVAGTAISVKLKGLTINGTGGTTGIAMTEGSSLSIEGVHIANFPAAASYGVFVSSPVDVKIVDSVIRDSYYGIYLQNGPSAAIANTQVLGTYTAPAAGGVFGTVYAAITVDNTSATTSTSAAAVNCVANGGDYQAYVALSTAAGGTANLIVDRSTAVGSYYGVYAGPGTSSSSGTASAAVSNSLFLKNKYALTAAGGAGTVSSSSNTFSATTGVNFNNIGSGSTLATLGNNGADSATTAGTITHVTPK